MKNGIKNNNAPQFVATMTADELKTLIHSVISETLQNHQPAAPTADPMPEFLTRKQAAAFLKCAVASIDNWSRAGLLKKHFIGGRTPRFSRDELRSVLNGHK